MGRYNNITMNIDSNFSKNYNVTINNNGLTFNGYVDVIKPLDNLYILVKFNVSRKNGNFIELFSIDENLCDILQRKSSNFFVNTLYKKIKFEDGIVIEKCPINPVQYLFKLLFSN